METTTQTVRCPNFRKKQEEPYPKRCGCGQSLLTVMTALRQDEDAWRREAAPQPADATTRTPITRPFDLTANEW